MSTELVLSGSSNLHQQFESLQRELYVRTRELADVREELRLEKAKNASVEVGARELRGILHPLFESLKMVFGEMDAMGVDAAAATGATPSGPDPRKAAIWDSWKAKLPSGEGKAIDALLLHGKLKTDQIRIHIGCATRTATNIVSSLKSKGLVVKDGAHYSLKEL